MSNLKNRDFLKIADFSREELTYLIRLAARLKAEVYLNRIHRLEVFQTG